MKQKWLRITHLKPGKKTASNKSVTEAIQRKTWREWYHEAKGGENFNEGTMVKWSTVVLKFVNLAKMELISQNPFSCMAPCDGWPTREISVRFGWGKWCSEDLWLEVLRGRHRGWGEEIQFVLTEEKMKNRDKSQSDKVLFGPTKSFVGSYVICSEEST